MALASGVGEAVGRTVRIGDVFRVAARGRTPSSGTYSALYSAITAGGYSRGADIQKGMFYYAEIPEPGQPFGRIPAFIFHSNPYKKGSGDTPWPDIVEPDAGYALFHGDNKTSGLGALESRGNAKWAEFMHFYETPELRKFAPPVLLFTQREVDGNKKGFREFSGYGVPVRTHIATQREHRRGSSFTNLVIEMALFRLDAEGEVFDWTWIDARRERGCDADRALRLAPNAWRRWVAGGAAEIERCRRVVTRLKIASPSEQLRIPERQRTILSECVRYFERRKHSFEGLASYAAQRILGDRCKRGWITKRSGDGGFDFVSRLDVGDESGLLSSTRLVVLGQAKCIPRTKSASGRDLARVVARLQRGWLGVFVTTGIFSPQCQREARRTSIRSC